MITFRSFLGSITQPFISIIKNDFIQDCPCGYPSQDLEIKELGLIKSNYKTKSLKIHLSRLFMKDFTICKFI